MGRSVPLGALLLGLSLCAGSVVAHEGHDHGPPPPSPAGDARPRVTAESADFELVGVLDGPELRVYLDQFATNRPVLDAEVEVESGAFRASGRHQGDGVYTSEAGPLASPGRHSLLFTVQTPTTADLLPGEIEVLPPAAEAGPVGREPAWYSRPLVLQVAVVVLAGWVLLLLARRDRRGPLVVTLVAAGLLAGALPDPARAHGGEDHDHPAAPLAPPVAGIRPVNGDTPARLPDGRVYVPKPAQRALAFRTALAEAGEWNDVFALNGHVIADPNASGLVQAPLRGRVEPAEAGLPLLGAPVSRGQVLAYLIPILDAVDRTTLQADLADIAGRVVILTRNLERLRQLGANAPRQELEQTEAELASLIERRKAITDSFSERRPLTAPVAGVVALRNASPGQIVESRDTLFTVVDPQRLWVEALLYDTEHATHFVAASARTADAQELALTPIAGGYELRGHALPLQFRIEPPVPFLVVRQPVRVLARAYHTRQGVRVPTPAVQKGPDGWDLVWVHDRPEHFRPQRVRAAELGGGFSLVTEGLEAGARVVTDAASLLGQVR